MKLDLMDISSIEEKKTPFRVVPITDAAKLETHLQYVKRVSEELKSLNIEKRPISTEQSESTKRLLSMSEEELKAYRNRPLPKYEDWKREDDAEKVFSTHKADHETVMATESIRHTNHGNRIGDAISEELSGIPLEVKEKAIEQMMKPMPNSPIENHYLRIGHIHSYPEAEKTKRSLWRRILDARWVWTEVGFKPSSWRDSE
jgi:hypothetical protein